MRQLISQEEFVLLMALHCYFTLAELWKFFFFLSLSKKSGDLTFFGLLVYSLFLPLQPLIKSSWPLGVLIPYTASHALSPLVKERINKLNSLFEEEFGMLSW